MKLGWLRPEEFWRLTTVELHWLFEAHQKPKMYGSYTEDEVRQMYEETYGPVKED